MEDKKLCGELEYLLKEANVPNEAILFDDVIERVNAIRKQYPNGFFIIQVLVAINESDLYRIAN